MSSLVKHRLPNDTTVVWNKGAPWTVEHSGKVISKHAREDLALKKAKAHDKNARPEVRDMADLAAEEEQRQATAHANWQLLDAARNAMQNARQRTGAQILAHDVKQGVWRTVLIVPCKGRRPLVLQMSRNDSASQHLYYLEQVRLDMVNHCLLAHACDAGRPQNEIEAINTALHTLANTIARG